jgi:tetratricopeptide (TPR) repeat protein
MSGFARPEARGDTSLKLDLIGGYLKVAGIQGDLWQENVGDPSAARQSLDRALQIAATLSPSDLSNEAARALVAQCEEKIGDLLGPAGERAAALDHYAKAPKMSQADLKGSVNLLTKIAGLQEDNGDPGAALESYRKAEPLAKDYAAKNPNSQGARRGVAFVEEGIGHLAMLTGDPAGRGEAESAVRSAIAIYESGSQTPAMRRNLAIAYKDLAEIRQGNGKAAAALESCRRALSIIEADPQNEELSIDLAENRQLLIGLLLESALRDEARKQTTAALARLRPLVQRDKPSIYYLAAYIGILDDTPFAELTRPDDRVPAAQRYVEIVRDSESLDLLARALERDGRSAEAAKVEAEALAMLPPAKPGRPIPENRRMLEARLKRMTAASAQAQHNPTAGRNQSQDPR